MARHDTTKPFRSSVERLVDDYAEARAAKKAADKAETFLRKRILDQFDARSTNRLEGETYEVTLSNSSREMLDIDEVRALLTPAEIARVTKIVPVTNLSVVELAEVVVRGVA